MARRRVVWSGPARQEAQRKGRLGPAALGNAGGAQHRLATLGADQQRAAWQGRRSIAAQRSVRRGKDGFGAVRNRSAG